MLLAEARDVLAGGLELGCLAAQADELSRELASRAVRRGGDWEHLTPAERRLLPLLTTHLTFREIADHLSVSRNTVKTQAICTYRKLGATSRSEAIQRAIDLGIDGALGRARAVQAALGAPNDAFIPSGRGSCVGEGPILPGVALSRSRDRRRGDHAACQAGAPE